MKVSHLRLPLPPQFCSSAACSFVSRPSPAVPRPEQASVDAVHQRPARGGLQLSLISSQPIQPTDLVLFWFWSVQFCDVCCLFILWDVAWLSFEAQIWDGSQFSGFSRLILRDCQTWQNFRNTKNWFVSTQNNATACNSGQSLTCCLVHSTHNIWSSIKSLIDVLCDLLAQVNAPCVLKMGEDEETRPCWGTNKWAFQMLM